MYTIGKRYRWWREVGETAYLNGSECTVIGPATLRQHPAGFPIWAQETDAHCHVANSAVCAFRGDLLPVAPDANLPHEERETCDKSVTITYIPTQI
jgi:hypothetical protein